MNNVLFFDEIHFSYENDSELVVSFYSKEYETFLSFVVSVPCLNRAINEAFNTSCGKWCFLLINGVRFRLFYSNLVLLKRDFNSLTK